MTSFYRVHMADDYFCGMYRSDCSSGMFELDTRHPSPQDDSALSTNLYDMGLTSYGCGYYGFKSLDQFRSWVYKTEWLDQLHEEGFVISKWQVNNDKVILGNTQAILLASMSKHEPVKTVNIHDYLQLD